MTVAATTHAAAGMGDDADLNVVPGESQSAADDKQKAGHPAQFAVEGHGPEVGQKRRRNAESHQIGQRIVFCAETAGGIRDPRDPAVETVKQQGDENGQGRQKKLFLDRCDNRIKSHK